VITLSNYQDTISEKQWEKVEQTKAAFEQAGIHYIYSISKTWLDFSSFEYVEKPEEVMEQDADDCFLKNDFRVYEGVLYGCPHQYAAERLHKITCGQGECVKLEESKSSYELSGKFFALKEKKYLDACSYCVVPHKAKEVPAGEQLEDDK
jgi:hypothetical protein